VLKDAEDAIEKATKAVGTLENEAIKALSTLVIFLNSVA